MKLGPPAAIELRGDVCTPGSPRQRRRRGARVYYRNERIQRRSMRSFHHHTQRPCALHSPRSAIA